MVHFICMFFLTSSGPKGGNFDGASRFQSLGAGFAALLFAVTAHAEFYVAVNGDDSAPGTAEKPFATLAHARDATRQLANGVPKRIVVRGGKYFGVTLDLNSADSGLTIEAAPGEKPVLYGGVLIKGWKKEGDKFYSAQLPQAVFAPILKNANGTAKFPTRIRMLQVDEKFATKARYPANGTLEHLSEFKVPWMSTTAGGFQRKPTQAELTTLSYKPADIDSSLRVEDAELEIYHMWDESSVGVAANDTAHHILTLSPPAAYPPGAFNVKKYVIWNTVEGMTSPGHWFHDRSRNCLVYWPLEGQDMTNAEVVAPIGMTIIRISGTAETPARNIRLKGLELSVTNTPMVSPGFAAGSFDGSVSLDHAENCIMEELTIRCVGGHAINSLSPCAGIQVRNCEIAECGAGGIYVSGTGDTITNNHIHNVGLQYTSAVGIFRGGKNFVVTHNEIHDSPYSAICFGGSENVIQDNLIYDCMKTLHDGAAIYLSGAKNCVIRGNLVRNIGDGSGTGASSFYLDEQCEDCVVEKNVSTTVSWPVQNNMARNNTIRNNVFITKGDARLGFTNCSGYTLEKNVVCAAGKIDIVNIDAIKTWSGNIFYSQTGLIEGIRQNGTKNIGTVGGLKGDTVSGDPLFQNPETGDYRYKIGSPAFQQGILPLDMSNTGRTKP